MNKKTMSPIMREKMEELAESYPACYEIVYMNADTPRMSGEHYLKFGYKAGFTACHDIMIERELKIVNEIQKIKWLNECHCEEYWKDYGRHAPNATCGEMDGLFNVLKELGIDEEE